MKIFKKKQVQSDECVNYAPTYCFEVSIVQSLVCNMKYTELKRAFIDDNGQWHLTMWARNYCFKVTISQIWSQNTIDILLLFIITHRRVFKYLCGKLSRRSNQRIVSKLVIYNNIPVSGRWRWCGQFDDWVA